MQHLPKPAPPGPDPGAKKAPPCTLPADTPSDLEEVEWLIVTEQQQAGTFIVKSSIHNFVQALASFYISAEPQDGKLPRACVLYKVAKGEVIQEVGPEEALCRIKRLIKDQM